MNVKEFEQKIKVIEDFLKQIESLEKILEVDGIILFGTKLINEYIKMLSEQINDKGEWLDWYVWENNFGEKKNKSIN